MGVPRSVVVVVVAAALALGVATPPPVRASEEADAPTVHRSAGAGRIATSVAVSADFWHDAGTVLMASGADFPDALAATALAARLDSPLLLSGASRLPDAVAEELERLGAEEVVLLGGSGAIDDTVAQQLRDQGYAVDRIAGDDRFDTARLAARAAGPSPTGEVVLALGGHAGRTDAWADAVAASTLAASPDRLPTLLTAHDHLPAATRRALDELAPERAVVVGGDAAISAGVVDAVESMGVDTERIGGRSRYSTGVALAGEALARSDGTGPVVLATGEAFPDSLAAGALAAATGAPLLLTASAHLPSVVDDHLREHGGDRARLVGGHAAASELVADQVHAALADAPRPEPSTDAETDTETDAERGRVFEGRASWYGAEFHGNPTACGETYDRRALTAAHPDLPCGTRLRVTNTGNDREVTVRVNDRGPFTGDRVLDVSRAAAEEIGMVAQGTAWIRAEVLAD